MLYRGTSAKKVIRRPVLELYCQTILHGDKVYSVEEHKNICVNNMHNIHGKYRSFAIKRFQALLPLARISIYASTLYFSHSTEQSLNTYRNSHKHMGYKDELFWGTTRTTIHFMSLKRALTIGVKCHKKVVTLMSIRIIYI